LPEVYSKAALRHFLDAEKLASCSRFDNAAHLVGFAAECAVKHCILELRLTVDAPHVHFPQLIEAAKRSLRGRNKHWVERSTVNQVRANSDLNNQLLPLELERSRSDPEGALLLALKNIGVVEYRNESRINMPDIFRVAAGIKRRGGVRPPQTKQRR
jgi:hypothetical protein